MSNRATTERPKSNKRRPTFDQNKFLTNCRMVAFDEIFRWRKFLAIQYSFQPHRYNHQTAWSRTRSPVSFVPCGHSDSFACTDCIPLPCDNLFLYNSGHFHFFSDVSRCDVGGVKCLNGGSCVDENDIEATCDCPVGFTGHSCQSGKYQVHPESVAVTEIRTGKRQLLGVWNQLLTCTWILSSLPHAV